MICRTFSHDCRHLLRCDVRRGYPHGCHRLVVAMFDTQVLRLHPPISRPTRQFHMNTLDIHPFLYFPTCEYLPLITPTPRYAKLQCLFFIQTTDSPSSSMSSCTGSISTQHHHPCSPAFRHGSRSSASTFLVRPLPTPRSDIQSSQRRGGALRSYPRCS